MTDRNSEVRTRAVAWTARSRLRMRSPEGDGARDFRAGEIVQACARVRNDGTYPHKDIGEVLVVENDVGCVRETWRFLGELYYTVEFFDRAVVVIMRSRELTGVDREAA